MVSWFPNFLGIFRLVCAPLVVVLVLQREFAMALLVFAVAGFTDAIDGPLARRMDAVSDFGRFLDPIADKALINAGFLGSAAVGIVPWWLAAAVALRDILILLIATFTHFSRLPYPILPLGLGKLSTGVQIAGLVAFLGTVLWGGPLSGSLDLIIIAVTAATAASAAAYLLSWGGWYWGYLRRQKAG